MRPQWGRRRSLGGRAPSESFHGVALRPYVASFFSFSLS